MSRATKKCPIHSRTQLLTGHLAACLAFERDGEFRRTRTRSVCDIAQMAGRSATAIREIAASFNG